jgi:hypothetical protein
LAAYLRHIFDDYRAAGLNCFICNNEITPFPPNVFTMPDDANPQHHLVTPLCARCRDLPPAVRDSRSFRVLKAMFRAATGKNLKFRYAQRLARGC